MKKLLFITSGFMLLTCSLTKAQSTLTNNGYIRIDSNTVVVVESDIEDSGTIDNNKNSEWHFAGITQQKINSTSSLKFGSLFIENPYGLSFNNHFQIDSQCALVHGKIFLNNYNCKLQSNAFLAGYNSSKYFVTNGSGQLIQTSPTNQTIVYPVGTINNYLPFTLSNKGVSDVYSIRTQDSSYLKYDSGNAFGLLNAVQSLAVNKTWIVNEEIPGGVNFDVTLQWNGTEELFGFNRNLAEIRYYDYSDSSWKTASNYLSANGSNPYSITKNISNLNYLKNMPLGVFTVGAPLPVELLSFEAKENNGDAILSWQTNKSMNSHYFTLQKSTTGIDFTDYKTVKSNNTFDYSYTDSQIFSQKSIVYYRIKLIDALGKTQYSKVILLRKSYPKQIQVYPNPCVNNLYMNYVSNKQENINIVIYNNIGVKVYSKIFSSIVGNNTFEMNIRQLPASDYKIIVNNGTENLLIPIIKTN